MSKKVYNLVSGIVGGVSAIAIAVVTYCVSDVALASAINASISVASTAIMAICAKFVKE